MHSAIETLGLERLDVIRAGEHTYPLPERTRAVAFQRLEEDLGPAARGRRPDGATTKKKRHPSLRNASNPLRWLPPVVRPGSSREPFPD